MKRDFSKPVTDFEGEDFTVDVPAKKEGEKPFQKVMTFRNVCTTALNGADADKIDQSQKLTRFKLALKIHDSKEPCEITIEEAALIKECVAKLYTPIVFGRLDQFLEEDQGIVQTN